MMGGSVPDTHYCAAFWQLYDDVWTAFHAGLLDERGVADRLREHRETCGECTKNYHNRHPMSISVDKSEER